MAAYGANKPTVVKTVDGDKASRPNVLGDLASRIQDGLRSTLEAIGQSHAQRLAAIVESSDDAIISTDLDGIVATWNRGAEILLGYAADEVVGKPVTILIPPDREGEEVGLLRRIREGDHVDHYRTQRRRKDGHLVQVSLGLSPIKDSSGTLIGVSKIARDVTAHDLAVRVAARQMDELKSLYTFTDQLFRTKSAGEMYDASLDAILRALRCERASILLYDDSGVMRFVAWRGLSEKYRNAVEGHSPWTPDTKDPQPLAVPDVLAADLGADLKATMAKEGIGAFAFIPLTVQGRLAGKFMTYYRTAHFFDDQEISLALTIARQLGFAIERAQSEERRRQAEKANQLLLAESTHRIKNTLATVQAIASQTIVSNKPEKDWFLARLRALGEAHELLTAANWDGALLGDVVDRALKPFRNDQADRIIAKGPRVSLAQTLP